VARLVVAVAPSLRIGFGDRIEACRSLAVFRRLPQLPARRPARTVMVILLGFPLRPGHP